MAVKARPLGRIDGHSNWAQRDFVVANGVTITAGDFVYFASGRITNASIATQEILGMATQTATGTAGSVKCSVIIDPLMTYLVDGDEVGASLGVTHVGTKFDLTGATGAQLVDTNTTSTTGSLTCIEVNPQIDPVKDDTSVGVFMINEHALWKSQ